MNNRFLSKTLQQSKSTNNEFNHYKNINHEEQTPRYDNRSTSNGKSHIQLDDSSDDHQSTTTSSSSSTVGCIPMPTTPMPSQNPSTTASRVMSPNKRLVNRSKAANNSSTADSSSSSASVYSSDDRRRSTGRHSCAVAEFNRFKNGLLGKTKSPNLAANQIKQQPNFLLTFSSSPTFKPSPATRLSTGRDSNMTRIRSIYEQVERDRKENYITLSTIEAKRAHHLDSLKRTQDLLSASLSIKKLN